ncbi:MAG: hypothetical protein ACYDHY_06885 [Acidiferrobacterales bacterium]
MRVGYSYWGFLGDHREDADGNVLSTPDGNATYSWAIIHELQKRGHTVFAMQQDRDRPATSRYGKENFSSFSTEKRSKAYQNMVQTEGKTLPRLDLLLVEWRFPIPGRNTSEVRGKPEYQPDLDRQRDILAHYSKTPCEIVLWDLDHKLNMQDELDYNISAILETSVTPVVGFGQERTRIEPPFVMADVLQFPTQDADPDQLLAYVGSRYERDEVIDRYVGPVQTRYPGRVHFYGNWTREPNISECKARWPGVQYHGRITPKDFGRAYAQAVACPLLAKESYLQTGFITPRPWEALLFGTIPVGLSEANGIGQYTNFVAGPHDLVDMVADMSSESLHTRHVWREELAHKLSFMDVKNFVNTLEEFA